MLLVTLCALPWFRRPEAWLAALFIASVFIPACTTRFARGRPYLLTDAVLITILFLWSRPGKDWPSPRGLDFHPAARGRVRVDSWLVVFARVCPAWRFLFAGFWRSALVYGGCWLAGSFLGCALTGHPLGIFIPIRAAHVRRVWRFCGHPRA